MSTPKILAFAGSTREGSFNKSLAKLAAEAARRAGAEVTLVDLQDLDLPLYDADFETSHGLPAGARRFKDMLKGADGLLIASPEYNSSISAVLKNALDWASRAEYDSEAPAAVFRGKVAALFSASPGALGGLRGLVHLRAILGNIGVLVLPDQVCISTAHQAIDADGRLTDVRKAGQVDALAVELVRLAGHLKHTTTGQENSGDRCGKPLD